MTNTLVEVTGSYFAIDFEVAPLPAFTVSSDSVTEGSSVNLIVTLNPTSTSATNVTYSTADGTASTAAGDYAVGGPTVLGFAVGQATSSITIFTTDDSLDEGDETILILLSNPIGGQSVIGGGGTVTINDDGDAPPTVSLASATQSVAEATTTINVVVNLSGQSGLPIAVTYTVTDGTATGGGVDYTGTSPIIIAAGSTSGNITVDIVGEDTFEKDETFDVNITGVTTTDQTITSTAPTSTAVTIENDDKPVTAVDTGGTTEDAVRS